MPAIAHLPLMRQVWRDAGRTLGTLYAMAQGSGCVLADGEASDSPPAKAQAGPSQELPTES